MSILKLAKLINTNERSAKKFREERWKRGFGCDKCGSIKAWKHRKLKNGLQKYRCEDCRHIFSDQSDTVLRWNKINIRKVAVINHFSHLSISIRELAKELDLNKNSVERLKSKIRKAKGNLYSSGSPPQLKGIIEMDETKIGGNWFLGGIERKHGRLTGFVEQIPARTEAILTSKIWKYIEEHATVMTDEWAGYYLHPRFFTHLTVNHSKEFVRSECRLIHTNNIENLWKQLKRKINHFCNGVKSKHVQEYINEYFYTKNYDQIQKPTFFPLYCQKD